MSARVSKTHPYSGSRPHREHRAAGGRTPNYNKKRSERNRVRTEKADGIFMSAVTKGSGSMRVRSRSSKNNILKKIAMSHGKSHHESDTFDFSFS